MKCSRLTNNSQNSSIESTNLEIRLKKSLTTMTSLEPARDLSSVKIQTSLNSSRKSSHLTSKFILTLPTPTGSLVSMKSLQMSPLRKQRCWWEPSLMMIGQLTSRKDKYMKLVTWLSRRISIQEQTGQIAPQSSTTFVTSPIVDPAGLSELQKHLMIVLALHLAEPWPRCILLPIQQLAAISSSANQWDAMVDKLEPHGIGSRAKESLPEDRKVMDNFVTTTLWTNVLIT